MAARRPPLDDPYHILTAARGATQGRSRPPLLPCPGRAARAAGSPICRLLLHLQGVLDRIELRELDVVELAVDLLDLADIDVLDDLAGVRIDRDRPARALPRHALHRADQGVGIGLAAGLLERLIDQVHAVVAAERDEVRAQPAVRLLEGGDVFL